jgi:hypothetical protein
LEEDWSVIQEMNCNNNIQSKNEVSLFIRLNILIIGESGVPRHQNFNQTLFLSRYVLRFAPGVMVRCSNHVRKGLYVNAITPMQGVQATPHGSSASP